MSEKELSTKTNPLTLIDIDKILDGDMSSAEHVPRVKQLIELMIAGQGQREALKLHLLHDAIESFQKTYIEASSRFIKKNADNDAALMLSLPAIIENVMKYIESSNKSIKMVLDDKELMEKLMLGVQNNVQVNIHSGTAAENPALKDLPLESRKKVVSMVNRLLGQFSEDTMPENSVK